MFELTISIPSVIVESYSLFNSYIHIFQYAFRVFSEISAKDDVLFLEELNKRAGALFDEDYITVEELYYRLATRYRHYLIDEFQDTSKLQWHNLEKMTEEALSTGGSLFYVGDRKQAIYGFRGGDVELFDKIKERFQPFNVRLEQLTNNWRSQKAIVDFNNAVFDMENLRRFVMQKELYETQKSKKGMVVFTEKDLQEIAHNFSAAHQSFQPANSAGVVRLEYINIDKKEERDPVICAKVIHLIKDLRERFTYRDMAILTRGNYEVEQLTNWLLEEGIPVESERTLNIKENGLIKELVAFLQFLNSPIDNIAFTHFLLGDIFSKASGLKTEELHAFVFSLREELRTKKHFNVYTAFRESYRTIWDRYLNEFFKNVGLYPLYELVVSMYSKLDCLKNFPEHQGFFIHFLEMIKLYEEEYVDLASFLEYFENLEGEKLYVHITDSDAVKILTIHKSKGLEFPVVILPFLGMEVQVGSGGSDNQQSYILRNRETFVELLRLKKKYLHFSEELYGIYAQEYKRAFLSELNSVYVALTRPQYELYGFVPKRVGNSFNLLKFLIPEEYYALGKPSSYAMREKETEKHEELPIGEYHDWIEYLKDEYMDFQALQKRDERLYGEIIHALLSEIGNLKGENFSTVIKNAFEQARLRFEYVHHWEQYKKIIKKIVKESTFQPFFNVDEGEVVTEKEIVNKKGHAKRIDRLIIKEEEVWVVDYKSTETNSEEYRQQVREYKLMIKEIYPHRTIKGFLLYLDTLKVEDI